MRTINEAGLELIKTHEGCKLSAYPDIGGIPTIGYGHTRGVALGQRITQDDADKFLLADLAVWENLINYKYPKLTDNQFAALVSLCFNVGTAPLNGTLGRYLNTQNMLLASKEFPKWNHVKGVVVDGLTQRRLSEQKLFVT